jgi:L-rhamnose isomerase
MVEPTARLREFESAADYTGRLALQEEIKGLPWGAVWDHYCATAGVPREGQWLREIREYERTVLAARG